MSEPFSIPVSLLLIGAFLLAVVLVGCMLIDLCIKVNKALGQNWEDNDEE